MTRSSKIKLRKSNICTLELRQIQLRNSCDENVSLVKSMESTLKKCITKLRRKLDERSSISSTSVKALMNDDDDDATMTVRENNNNAIFENSGDKGSRSLHEKSVSVVPNNINMTQTERPSQEANNNQTKTTDFDRMVVPSEMENNLGVSHSVVTSNSSSATDVGEKSITLCMKEKESINSEAHLDESKDAPKTSLVAKDNFGNEVFLKYHSISSPIQKVHTNDALMKKIWSQVYPYNEKSLPQQTKKILREASTLFPLISPVPSEKWYDLTVCKTNVQITRYLSNCKEMIIL